MASSEALTHAQRVTRLYRKSLKHLLSWTIDRAAWRTQALQLRALFDANKDIKDVGKARALLELEEKNFEQWKHPDPYITPDAPDGSKWERNMPPPPHVLEMTPDEKQWLEEWKEYYSRR